MRTIWLAAVAASSFWACGGATDQGMPGERSPVTPDWATPAASSAPAPSSTVLAPPPKEDAVVVTSVGAAPRRALRYVFHAGTVEPMVLDMHMAIAAEVDGHTSPLTTMPGVRMRGALHEDRLTPAGNLVSSYTLDSVELTEHTGDPNVNQKILDSMQKIVGMSIELEFTPRGGVAKGKATMPEKADPTVANVVGQIEDNLHDIAIPLPEEPVGVGATWTGTRTVHTMFDVTNQSTFRLVRLEGDHGVLDADIVVSAQAQPVDMHGPTAVVMTLQSMKGSGKAKTQFDLQRLMHTSDVDMQADTVMSFQAQGADHRMHMQMETQIHVAPGK